MSENVSSTENSANDNTGQPGVQPAARPTSGDDVRSSSATGVPGGWQGDPPTVRLNASPVPATTRKSPWITVENIVAGVVLFGFWAVGTGFMSVIVPKFLEIYNSLGAPIYALTQFLIDIDNVWHSLLGVVMTFGITLGLTIAYAHIPSRGLRLSLLAAFIVLAILLLVVGIVALYLPLGFFSPGTANALILKVDSRPIV